MAFIYVRHNIEIAHRLMEAVPGKCEQIHGHSMLVELFLHGQLDSKGVLDGMDFGNIKKAFREHLDFQYDHHLLLNERDPFTRPFVFLPETSIAGISDEDFRFKMELEKEWTLPGLVTVPGDPTTENIAKWIAEWACDTFNKKCDVIIHETNTNGAGYSVRPRNGD